jgi:hypothetical protein
MWHAISPFPKTYLNENTESKVRRFDKKPLFERFGKHRRKFECEHEVAQQDQLEIPVPHGVHAIPEAENIKSGIPSPPNVAVCLVNIVIDLHESSSCDSPQCGCVNERLVKRVAHHDKQHCRDEDDGTDGFPPYSRTGGVTPDVVEQDAAIENGMQDS